MGSNRFCYNSPKKGLDPLLIEQIYGRFREDSGMVGGTCFGHVWGYVWDMFGGFCGRIGEVVWKFMMT